MIWTNIFYGVCWTTTLLVLWFKTDWILHYCQMLNIFRTFRQSFSNFISNNPQSFFPDYLYEILTKHPSRYAHFLGKLLSCPLCLGFWLTVVVVTIFGMPITSIGPVYIGALFTFFLLKKFI